MKWQVKLKKKYIERQGIPLYIGFDEIWVQKIIKKQGRLEDTPAFSKRLKDCV